MRTSVKQLLREMRRNASRRRGSVATRAMGRKRVFNAYDAGDDTFVFEKGVWRNLDAHASVLLASKRDLRSAARRGHVMVVTTGNHSVGALPLLQGLFWDLCRLDAKKRGEVMMHCVLCANVVDGKLEISQRDVPFARLAAIDEWLVGTLRFANSDVVMVERNDQTLEYFRRRGQEWRVKPLAWTDREMSAALAASRKRISTTLSYYHGTRGVHFLSYPEFHRLSELAKSDFPQFQNGLHELVSVFEGHDSSFLRENKYHGHHEVELFGLRRGVALERLVPELEMLMEGVVTRRFAQDAVVARIAEIDVLYRSLLTRPELADETSKAFVETLYMYITGEIYSVMGEGATPAFDDRRTALPGGTFENGVCRRDPLCDARSEVLLSNLRALASRDENIEYANVYELRTNDAEADLPIGEGSTREVVYKTNCRPLVTSLVEKRLARPGRGYGSYVIARAQAFKSLGVELPDYRLLRRWGRENLRYDYFIRTRCEGEPLADIPAHYFQLAGEFGGADAGEDPQVVRALAFLMGDAAAQNLVMKKYDHVTKTPLYGVGKEIYRFGYDIKAGRLLPQGVSYCSVRGSLGWPDLSRSDRNLDAIGAFYLAAFAKALADFAARHPVCTVAELGERFSAGFEFRLRAMEWAFTVRRDDFEGFRPELKPRYGFLPRWHFALWALERHVRRMDGLRARFKNFVEHPDSVRFGTPAEDVRVMEDANAANVLDALSDIEIRFIGENDT
jgi:hypothetical protein